MKKNMSTGKRGRPRSTGPKRSDTSTIYHFRLDREIHRAFSAFCRERHLALAPVIESMFALIVALPSGDRDALFASLYHWHQMVPRPALSPDALGVTIALNHRSSRQAGMKVG